MQNQILGEAKIDRAVYRTSTIQKQDPKSKRYSTIWSETSLKEPMRKSRICSRWQRKNGNKWLMTLILRNLN